MLGGISEVILVVKMETARVPSCEDFVPISPKSSGYLQVNVLV